MCTGKQWCGCGSRTPHPDTLIRLMAPCITVPYRHPASQPLLCSHCSPRITLKLRCCNAHLQLLHQVFAICFRVTSDCDSAILQSVLLVAQETCYHPATLRRVRTARRFPCDITQQIKSTFPVGNRECSHEFKQGSPGSG